MDCRKRRIWKATSRIGEEDHVRKGVEVGKGRWGGREELWGGAGFEEEKGRCDRHPCYGEPWQSLGWDATCVCTVWTALRRSHSSPHWAPQQPSEVWCYPTHRWGHGGNSSPMSYGLIHSHIAFKRRNLNANPGPHSTFFALKPTA